MKTTTMLASSFHYRPILFPASLLSRRRQWQNQVQQTSGTRWVLVMDPNNPKQTRAMLRLGKRLERQGKQVAVVSVEK